jgi:DNA-binding GntR family transcriptional regulator
MTDRLSDETITVWADVGNLAMQTAATLARELRGRPRWFPVETEREVASRLGVSIDTASRAKRLLAKHGVIVKHGQMYIVA